MERSLINVLWYQSISHTGWQWASKWPRCIRALLSASSEVVTACSTTTVVFRQVMALDAGTPEVQCAACRFCEYCVCMYMWASLQQCHMHSLLLINMPQIDAKVEATLKSLADPILPLQTVSVLALQILKVGHLVMSSEVPGKQNDYGTGNGKWFPP